MIVDVHTHVWETPCHIGEQFIHDAKVTAGEGYKDISVDLDRHWQAMQAVDRAVVGAALAHPPEGGHDVLPVVLLEELDLLGERLEPLLDVGLLGGLRRLELGQGAHRAALVHAERPGLDHRLAAQDMDLFRFKQAGMFFHG